MIKALILDLDDTIFPTSSIDPFIVKPFFDALDEFNDVLSEAQLKRAKDALWRRPFHTIAKDFNFSDRMVTESLKVLNSLDFSFSLKAFDDYKYLKANKLDKFLVTTGITKLQVAKIKSLELDKDYLEILIDDPMISLGGKEALFEGIMQKYKFSPDELIVIGDNPDSEIKAGKLLGMKTLLINRKIKIDQLEENVISSLEEVQSFI